METTTLKKQLLKKKQPKAEHPGRLSSGLTVVNLACSGRATWAFKKGHYFMFVGGSQAGKTWMLMSLMAEAAHSPDFAKYRLIHDNPERGSLMDIVKFFGQTTKDRLEPPGPDGKSSRTLEQIYDYVDDAVKAGKPFIYGLDSEDALPPEAEINLSEKNKKKRRKLSSKDDEEDKIKGSYGTAKAKLNSSNLRIAHNALEDNGSMLFFIKQSRQNIGWDSKYNPDTRSGGMALTFYATLELWFKVAGKIRKRVRGKERVIGSILKIHVKKNRVSGRDRTVLVHFYPTIGFDEVGSNLEYLIDEKHWQYKIEKDVVTAPEFKFEGSKEEFVRMIEEKGLEKELRLLVVDTWNEIEKACEVVRKPRYS